jgi:DNA mismatch endonuclease (patch repair protein)
VFAKLRIAIFVDGCFWHQCPRHSNVPANNRAFWERKLAGNRKRDRLVVRTLRARGLHVLRVWEHELSRRNQARLLGRMRRAMQAGE